MTLHVGSDIPRFSCTILKIGINFLFAVSKLPRILQINNPHDFTHDFFCKNGRHAFLPRDAL